MRGLSFAVPVAIAVCVAAPAFADAQSQVQAAKKFEKRGEWKKALDAWKAAYSADVNAEYLIGIGDCYAHLGNNDEAKKNYNAYLADPLALPNNVEKVKTKLADLDNPGGGLALPGAGLALPGADAPPPLPGAAPPLPGLDLPGAAPMVAVADKKGKKKKGGAAPPSLPGLDLPGLDLPGATPVLTAEKKPEPGPGLALPGLDLPGATPAPSKKEPEKKVASASPGLELPGLPGTAPPPKKEPVAVASSSGTPPPAAKEPGKPVAVSSTPPKETGKQVASSGSPPKERRPVPEAVIAQRPPPSSRVEAGGGSNVLGYVAAGAAVVGLGVGGFGFLQSSSAHSDLTGTVHDSATAQSLLDKEKSNKTLSFIGLASGLVFAGVATAFFAF